jgi:hypothetical protein
VLNLRMSQRNINIAGYFSEKIDVDRRLSRLASRKGKRNNLDYVIIYVISRDT